MERRRGPAAFGAIGSAAAVTILGATLFLVFFGAVLGPRLALILSDFGSELPWPTRVVLHRAFPWAAVLFLAVGTLAGMRFPRERAIVWSLTGAAGVLLATAAVLAAYLPILGLAAAIKG